MRIVVMFISAIIGGAIIIGVGIDKLLHKYDEHLVNSIKKSKALVCYDANVGRIVDEFKVVKVDDKFYVLDLKGKMLYKIYTCNDASQIKEVE